MISRKTLEHQLTLIKFLIAVFGPTVASWSVLFYALVKAFFRRPSRGTWWALVMSVVVWASMDSALSIYYGLYPAVALNAVVASLFLGLLFNVRQQAFKHQTTQHASRPAQS